MGKEYGYVRVSSKDQNLDRQLVEMRRLHIQSNHIFGDKESGKNFDRIQYQELLELLEEGDTMYVPSIDRLGRNYEEILDQWRHITREIKANISVLDMPLLDTRRGGGNLTNIFVGDIVLQILSYCAENERSNIRSRQRSGIDEALKKGVHFGAREKPLPENFTEMYEKWKRGEISIRKAAKCCGMAKSTFYEKVSKRKRLTD